jgi:Zn-dependent peptidase ImmA (M78 family)/DNA-binding XRE family transcriptional regulator
MFNRKRLTVARQRALLTKTELARKIAVEPRAISGFEAGEYPPSDENIDRIARVLCFPREFFLADDLDIPTPEGVSFRSMEKMTARQRDAAISAGAIAYLLIDWVEREFDLPEVDIPDLREDEPEIAAIALRQHWGLGERPIKNMVHLLEAKGIRVCSLVENCLAVDAYSVWRGKRPCVFLNLGKSAERRRFDAAHELGHLVLHKHAAPSGIEAEKEANAFASAFLMPAASMKAISRVTSLNQVIDTKRKWNVSVAAMTYRLHELGIMSKWTYQTLYMEISRRGYRASEPYESRPETSVVWKKVFDDLRKDNLGIQGLAAKLLVPAEELVKLVFGLVTIGIPSGTAGPSGAKRTPNLHLVEKQQ